MNWTTNKPTKPGPYWYEWQPKKPEIVLICKHGESLIVWFMGASEFSHLRGLPIDARWFGPIEKPE